MRWGRQHVRGGGGGSSSSVASAAEAEAAAVATPTATSLQHHEDGEGGDSAPNSLQLHIDKNEQSSVHPFGCVDSSH